MEFRKRVQIVPSKSPLIHGEQLLVMGSCFAEHIGGRLVDGRFRTLVNPFGVLYNPASIAASLRLLMNPHAKLTKQELFEDRTGRWHSFAFHSSLSGDSAEEALTKMNRSIEVARSALRQTSVLIITFGTAWVYRLVGVGEVVGNCHKEPAHSFGRERLRVSEIVAEWRALLQELNAFRHGEPLRIIFTVSPIRHWKDGAFGNQCSKATLLLAIDELLEHYPQASYFPAYEIFMDELRDYRFYDPDMIHPSSVGISYVWERFAESYLSETTRRELAEWEQLRRMLAHRSMSGMSESHRKFLSATLQKLEEFAQRYPRYELNIELEALRKLCNTF